ncbi:MAG: hypothetical protein JXC32_19330 [Anaerolineae bacterium]|nr:hypothetical protein [Anaerolineae bacterium]
MIPVPTLESELADLGLAALDAAEQLTDAVLREWLETCLYIRDKERRVIPLRLNWAQADYYEHRTQRDIILKARQLGFTTLICGLFFADTILRPNTTSVIVAHDTDSSEKIFRIVQLFWERLPAREQQRVGKPRFSNRREFLWPQINSQFYVGTAGAKTFGRGQTINNLHCSEFAFWPNPLDALTALTEAVPADGRIVIESTANGVGNYLHDLWTEAKQQQVRYAPHFYVWWENPAYALPGPPLGEVTEEERELRAKAKQHGLALSEDQLRWRREKAKDLRDKFLQEYPEDDVTCFLTSGRCCFDVQALLVQHRRASQTRPEAVASIPGKKGTTAVAPATLSVWRRPQSGKRYVIGVDIGEGLEGRDASAAFVLERETGEQVAELHGWVAPDRFARLVDALGRWYHLALVAVERNNHGHSTLNTLSNVCRYPRLYKHVKYDANANVVPVLGWPTDQSTKPILVDDLAAAIADGHIVLNSPALIDECLTFVTTDTGAQEAQEGKRDDRVLAAGIAWQARKRGWARPSGRRPPGW